MVNEPSTCPGGTLNSTAYWTPAMLDTSTDPGTWRVVSNYLTPCAAAPPHTTCSNDRANAMQAYYKDGYLGVEPLASDYPYTVHPTTGWVAVDVQNFPPGLRIVAGDAKATEAQPTSVVEWWCAGGPAFNQNQRPGTQGPLMPTCDPGDILVLTVAFPQCWDGEHLTDHDPDDGSVHSHMAYGAGWPDNGCPLAYPVPLPQITELFRWRVPPEGMDGWMLSSDTMVEGTTPGTTAHADWYNGWHAPTFQMALDNLYAACPGWRDGEMELLGPFTECDSDPDGVRLK
jgi:hypothetical protein